MTRRLGALFAAFVIGAIVAVAAIRAVPSLSSLRGGEKSPAEAANPDGRKDAEDNLIKLTNEQIEAARITLVNADKAELVRRTVVPGTIVPHADRIAHVSVRLVGTVAELRRKIGDLVAKGDVLAVIESREVADAKSEFLAARLTNDLQQELFQRDKVLWENKFATEQVYLRSRASAAQAKVALDIARQKLVAIGLTEAEITALPSQPEADLRFQPVFAPIAGQVVERRFELGMAVGSGGQQSDLFVLSDLSVVWVELAVSGNDLPGIVTGQRVTVTARNGAQKAAGRIIFISPMLDKETRTARVVAEIDNSDGQWRPGSFVNASIASDARPVAVAVPVSALQSINGQRVVFVRTVEGFEKRPVVVGTSDEQIAEVTGGLKPSETVATTNTFLLKSELLKGGTED